MTAAVQLDCDRRSTCWSWLEDRVCGLEYPPRGRSGLKRTWGAVKPLRFRTRSMVRPQGSGQAARGLQRGMAGPGHEQTVAGGRRGLGLEPAADGGGGPLQFGWDPLGALVAGPHLGVEGLGSGLSSGR